MPPQSPTSIPSPRALIFDCDGTLADSMPLHWRAWNLTSERYGFRFPKERFYSMGGVPTPDIVRTLSREQGLGLDASQVARDKEALYLPLIAQLEPVNLVVSIARENFGKIPLAVASGGNQKIIKMVLDHLGITHLFKAIVTNEQVENHKPAPDIFLEAARQLGVPPKFCRAFEDTDIGLQAIRAAGMEAVDVRELLTRCGA